MADADADAGVDTDANSDAAFPFMKTSGNGATAWPRPVLGLLLLQHAVSCWCRWVSVLPVRASLLSAALDSHSPRKLPCGYQLVQQSVLSPCHHELSSEVA